jgi:hypothetical protein
MKTYMTESVVAAANLTKEITMHTDTLASIRSYVLEQYNAGKPGFDVFIECWGDSEYTELLNDCGTLENAMESADSLAEAWAERESDHRSEAEMGM